MVPGLLSLNAPKGFYCGPVRGTAEADQATETVIGREMSQSVLVKVYADD